MKSIYVTSTVMHEFTNRGLDVFERTLRWFITISRWGNGHNDGINKAFIHLLFNSQLRQCCQATQINGQEVITGLTQSPLGSCEGK